MTSLRRRLTIAYSIVVGAFLALVAVVLGIVVLDAVVRPVQEAVDGTARDARAIIAGSTVSQDPLIAQLRQTLTRPGITVTRVRLPGDPGGPGGFGGPGGNGGAGGPGGGGGPPPNDARGPQSGGPAPQGDPGGPGPQPGPGNPGGFRPSDRGGFMLFGLVGLHPQFVRVGRAAILIAPDRQRLEGLVRNYLLLLLGVLLIALVIAWLIARWIANAAVAPLDAVTGELRRFASGDFTPQPIPQRGASDLSQLIEAYNGAASQVVAAFDERQRAEERMRRFLADAGHELRTPLAIVTAYVDVLRKGGVDDERVRAQAFAALGTETTRMRRLVERLVALARLEASETTRPTVVDLMPLSQDAANAVIAARGGDVTVTGEAGAIVLADPADLHEAISNLIDNALKYGGGSEVRLAIEHAGADLVLRVSNGGPPIPPDEQEKVFERFYRGSGAGEAQGTGLGLAIAARAAQRAGGSLTLERSDPEGTVFALRVPRHVEAA